MQNFCDIPLTVEEENWLRVSFLLKEEATVWVARIIVNYLNVNCLELNQFLNAYKKSIEKFTTGKRPRSNDRPKVLTLEQYELLFPADGTADIGTLDLNLLVIVIGLLRILPTPPCGWNAREDPPMSDLDPASDLVRLRLANYRMNKTEECAIRTEDFERLYDKLVGILQRLGANVEELDRLKDREVAKEQRRQMNKRIVTLFCGDLPDAEEYAQEKMKELAERHKKLKMNGEEEEDFIDFFYLTNKHTWANNFGILIIFF